MSLDWLIDRGKWRSFALALRQEFDANKSVENQKEKEELLLAGKHLLYKYRHPEPYICNQNKNSSKIYCQYSFYFCLDPSAPGGAAYDRETRLPQNVKN